MGTCVGQGRSRTTAATAAAVGSSTQPHRCVLRVICVSVSVCMSMCATAFSRDQLLIIITPPIKSTGGLNPRAFRRRHLKLPRAMGGGDSYGPQGPPEGLAAGEEWSLQERRNHVAETGVRAYWVLLLG